MSLRHKLQQNIYLNYFLCFLVVGTLVFAVVPISKSTLIWNSDGIAQHYPALLYWRRLLRGLVFHHHLFAQWDWNIGLGSDTFQVLSYYVMGDIFTYPSIFFSQAHMAAYYSIFTVLRLFLCGVTFIFSAKRLLPRAKSSSILVASFVYVFSGYSAYVTFTHPFFLNPLIILPLLIYSINSALTTGRIVPLFVMTAWTLFNNFYLGAVMGLGMVIYWLILLITKPQLRDFILNIRLILSVIGGIGLSAVLFIPSFYQLMVSARSSSEVANGMTLYPLAYYLTLPGMALSNYSRPYWVTGGILAIGIIAVLWSLRRFRQYLVINLTFMVSVIILLVPFLGALMNGGSSPSNRWTFLVMFPIAVAVIYLLDNLNTIDRRDIIVFTSMGLIVAASLFITHSFSFKFDLGGVLIIYACFVILLILTNSAHAIKMPGKTVTTIVLILTCANGVIIMRDRHANQFSQDDTMLMTSFASQQLTTAQKAYEQAKEQITPATTKKAGLLRSLIDNQLGNYLGKAPADNLPILAKTNNINSYWSLQNNYLEKLNNDLENNTSNPNDVTNTGDYRSLLLQYFGVARFFKNTTTKLSPTSYEVNGETTNAQQLLTTTKTMPLIYQSAGIMSKKQFSKLDPSQREAALITNTVTNKAKGNVDQTLLNKVVKIPFSYLNGATTTKKHVSVTMPTTSITPYVTIDSEQKNVKGYELHARLTNISFSAGSLTQRYQNATNNYIKTHNEAMMLSGQDTDLRYSSQLFKLNWLRKNATSMSGNTGTFSIQLGYGQTSNVFEQMGNDNLSFYDPQTSTTLNLGTIKSSNNLITLTLPTSGTYQFDLTLWAVPTKNAATRAINKNTAAKNIKINKNEVTATYQAKKAGILVTTIPYSAGWHLAGSTTKLPRVNDAFIGIPVSRGQNHIKLVYSTPLLHISALISLLSFVILLLIISAELFNKHRSKNLN